MATVWRRRLHCTPGPASGICTLAVPNYRIDRTRGPSSRAFDAPRSPVLRLLKLALFALSPLRSTPQQPPPHLIRDGPTPAERQADSDGCRNARALRGGRLAGDAPSVVLEKRYAKGEITRAESEQMKKDLLGWPRPPGVTTYPRRPRLAPAEEVRPGGLLASPGTSYDNMRPAPSGRSPWWS